MKRATRKKAKPGQLRMFYGRLPDDSSPDICYSWGDGCSKRDGSLLNWVMANDRPGLLPGDPYFPSLLKELESRGYDLSTLEFSIKKKSTPEQ